MQLKSVRFIFSIIAVLTVVMVLIGGATRLTNSGLSMVRWEPVRGIIPPLNQAAWETEFTHYQQFPEYQKLTTGISIEDFKKIFFWEYLHRAVARTLGLVAFAGFLFIAFRKDISARFKWAMFGTVIWIGLQGVAGWFMVKSGLVNRPSVSHFRLALHLWLAFGLFIYCIYWMIQAKGTDREPTPKALKRSAWALLVLVAAQITYGAFTAGLDAGIGYNTWPLMGGHILPSDAWRLTPIWHNFYFNPVMVQFIHRTLGLLVLLGVIDIWRKNRTNKRVKMLLWVTVLQVVLGILTLVMMVPVHMALTHQVMALILLMSVAFLLF